MKTAALLLAALTLSACAWTPDETGFLDQDFYGRWEGALAFDAHSIQFQTPISLGLSIDKTEGWVNICYLPDEAKMGSLTGTGQGTTLEVDGNVKCPPINIPNGCKQAILTWTYAALLLQNDTTMQIEAQGVFSHVTASGFVEGCDLKPTPFLAIGDLKRVSH
jgi:hypothetical protein